MEKRNWLWKRKSSDRSSGETESSGSISLHSERYSDDQDILKESPNNNTQSPEVTSKATVTNDEIKDGVKSLTEKLSAALVNVSAKEDLVKQHSKVAEEAVAGWEKAENEVAALKQQLEVTVQQNVALEVRVSHLDGALKECVRQLRQAKEEQEQRIHDVVVARTSEWESIKAELESKILELQTHIDAAKAQSPALVDPDVCHLQKENCVLKAELLSQSEELEIRTIERDLSTQAAETASKQQLESIKKVAKLEAECRRLQAIARKSSANNDQKSIAASSIYVESLTDSQSDSGELVNAVDIDAHKMSKLDQYDSEPSCSDSWASALIAELDQFKHEKAMTRNLAASSVEIDMMDDFLEMERLAALHDTKTKIPPTESCVVVNKPTNAENTMKAELETMTSRVAELEDKLVKIGAEKAELEKMTSHMAELQKKLVKIEVEKAELENMTSRLSELEEKLVKIEAEKAELENTTSHVAELQKKLVKIEVEKAELENMTSRLAELEKKLVKIEADKAELENALNKSQDSLRASQAQLGEAEITLEELQKELASVSKSKELLEFQLIGMEVDARTMAANIDSLKEEVEKEQNSSAEMAAKCREFENELKRKSQEFELQQMAGSSADVKVKQEDLAVAADKLAECQKTIASLGRQLQSLATLEDFLIDTANLPGFSEGASLVPRAHAESWKLHSNGTFISRCDSDPSETPGKIASHSQNGNDGESPASSSSSTSSTNHTSSSKSRNGFEKLFSRSKNGKIIKDDHKGI